jgi:hypothetical protein
VPSVAITRYQIIAWTGLVLVATLLVLRGFGASQLGQYADDGEYILLARSLIEADSYGLINAPGTPTATRFPFVYPMVLAPLVALFPGNVEVLKVTSLLATLLNAALLFWGWPSLVPGRSRWWAVALTGLYLVTDNTVAHARLTMSEPLFTTFTLIVLILAGRAAKWQRHWWWSVALSVALTAAMFTRTVGILLAIVTVAYLAFALRSRVRVVFPLLLGQMACILTIAVLLTPLSWKDLVPEGYVSSSEEMLVIGPIMKIISPPASGPPVAASGASGQKTDAKPVDLKFRVWDAFQWGTRIHLFGHVRDVAISFGGGSRALEGATSLGAAFLPGFVGVLVFLLTAAGLVREAARSRWSPFICFGLVYLLATTYLWRWNGTRMLYPIQSQLQFGLLLGIELVAMGVAAHLVWPRLAPGRFVPVVCTAVVCLIVSANVYRATEVRDSRAHVGILPTRTEWIRTHTAPSDTVMTQEPVVDFLYSERHTVPFMDELRKQTADDLYAYIVKRDVTYVLLAPSMTWRPSYAPTYLRETELLARLLAELEAQQRIELVHTDDETGVRVYATAQRETPRV